MEVLIRERLDALINALGGPEATCALVPRPKRIVNLSPGELIAEDDCCSGQLTARVVSLAPKFNQTAPQLRQSPCSVQYWVVTAELAIRRCAAVVNDNGEAPSADQLTSNGRQGLSDANQMLKAIQSFDWVKGIGNWTPSGPNGGCHGGSWTITFWVDSEPCA